MKYVLLDVWLRTSHEPMFRVDDILTNVEASFLHTFFACPRVQLSIVMMLIVIAWRLELSYHFLHHRMETEEAAALLTRARGGDTAAWDEIERRWKIAETRADEEKQRADEAQQRADEAQQRADDAQQRADEAQQLRDVISAAVKILRDNKRWAIPRSCGQERMMCGGGW